MFRTTWARTKISLWSCFGYCKTQKRDYSITLCVGKREAGRSSSMTEMDSKKSC